MDRNELYRNWDTNLKYERFIRRICGPVRYKLLWEVREFLETFFQIEIDDIAPGTELLEAMIRKQYQAYDINNSFEEIKHSYFKIGEEIPVLIQIYYLIIFANLEKRSLETFKYTLKKGLSKIIVNVSLLVEDKSGFISTYNEFVDDIINEFSKSFIESQS